MRASFRLTADQRLILLLLLAGAALRLLWLSYAIGPIADPVGSAEASHVAVAVAQGRGIADGYYRGYGPTAHLMPVSPAIAGGFLWLFGLGSHAGNLALLAWCLAQVGLAYMLLMRLFERIGTGKTAAVCGLGLLCLLAPFAPQETVDFRYWEGASGTALAAANLLLIAQFENGDEPNWRDMALTASLFAVTLFVCPPAGVAAGVCWSVWALRRLSVKRCVQLATTTAVALALVLGPWALRNQRELGAPVLLRSNLGLELALANHAEALSDQAPAEVFAARLREIHPFQAGAVKPGGEVAYAHALGVQTWHWIAAHPGGFATLYVRHLRELFFPPPWLMSFSGWGGFAGARSLAISLVNLLGLIGLYIGLRQRRPGYWIVATYVAALTLPYALFQPTARYLYLIYVPLAYPAVETALKSMRRLFRRARTTKESRTATA